ncbi:MAG: tRNA 2-thiouridine(34) synthase MnmA [Phycisphaerae bacterium]|nr:tRNA 2-thiouridine(34) synthase MnmA [Phycisphaerae bacterium]
MSSAERKVIVAMSGGVDSSVAAAFLLEAGYQVTGVFMCLGAAGPGDGQDRCCSPEDAADARRVAGALGIDMYVLDLADAFRPIIDNFLAEYSRGRTPNPCVHCNSRIKFGRLMQRARELGAAYVATGHHARIVTHNGQPAIARGLAADKDQSYALFAVGGDLLGRMLLPIGQIARKSRVRQIARSLGLNVHDKADSQEVCFVPDDDYAALLRSRSPEAMRPGTIVSSAGEVLGEHDGFGQFTIGQRRGLKVAAGEAMYVTGIDASTAAVTIGPRDEVPGKSLTASCANWHCEVPEVFDATVQIRYNHRGCPGRVRVTGPESFAVDFTEKAWAITPGQAAVVYDGDVLLGGGWID